SNKYAPNYVQSANAIQANVVSTQQAIEDFNAALQGASSNTGIAEEGLPIKGPIPMPVIDDTTMQKILEQIKKIEASMNKGDGEERDLIVTTAAGDKVYYKDSEIDHVVMADGTIICATEPDHEIQRNGALWNCEIRYTDGTILYMLSGKVSSVTKPDGTVVTYNDDEKVKTITYKGSKEFHEYVYSDEGTTVTVNGGEKVLTYNTNNRLSKAVINTASGTKTVIYDDGILVEVDDKDGTIYRYGQTNTGTAQEPEYTVTLKEIALADKTTYLINRGTITEVRLPDGRYITNFLLDDQYRLVSGLITCATPGVYAVIEDYYKTEEVNQYFIRTIYEYVDKIVPNKYNKIITADINADGKKEKIIDFGEINGTWIQYTDGTWSKLHDLSPVNIVPIDLNANGREDLIVDFGTAAGGVWIWYDNAGWEQLNAVSPVSIVTTQLDPSGKKGLVVDFGAKYGVFLGAGPGNWYKINSATAKQIVSCDIDGDKVDELVIDFGPQYGILIWKNKTYTVLNYTSAVSIVPIRLDASGKKGLVIDFGPQYGILLWSGPGAWYQMNGATAEQILACDTDGDKVDEVVIDFGTQYGIYLWDNKVYKQLDTRSSKQITAGDIDGNGRADVVIDFDTGAGILIWMNNGWWVKKSSDTACSITLSDLNGDKKDEIIIDFGAPLGIKLNYLDRGAFGGLTDCWSQVHEISPGSINCVKDSNGNWMELRQELKANAKSYFVQFDFPGTVFKSDCTLDATYDYKDLPYYNTFVYDSDRLVKTVTRPDNVVIQSNDGVLSDIISGGQTVSYEFDRSALGNVETVLTRKAGVDMTYDPATGQILSLVKDGAKIVFGKDSIKFKLLNDAYIDASSLGTAEGTGALDDCDESGNVVGHREYKDGRLVFYRDKEKNEYSYDNDGNLTQFKKCNGDNTYVTYTYYESNISVYSVSAENRAGMLPGDLVYAEYETIGTDTRVIYSETNDGQYKEYTYTSAGTRVIEGTIISVDGIGVRSENCAKTYDTGDRLVMCSGNDGTISEFFYDTDGALKHVSVKQDGAVYVFEDGRIVSVTSKDGTVKEYDEKGLLTRVKKPGAADVTYSYGSLEETGLISAASSNGTKDHVSTAVAADSLKVDLTGTPDQNVKLLLNFNGTNGQENAISEDPSKKAATFNGDAKLDTEDKVLGPSSLSLDGSGDYCTVPDSSDWVFGTGDFSMELFVKFDSLKESNIIMSQHGANLHAGADGWALDYVYQNTSTNTIHRLGFSMWENQVSKIGMALNDWVPNLGQWYKIAVTRENGCFKFYLDGTQVSY
ncbi:MAG: hypothetical protein PHS37_09475, partial [Candidatus Omnitrophica bacterium]|nr:hypothetical protein [Candidatus Omnitrophota bacterium]